MLKTLKELFVKDELLAGNYGIEREMLRVNSTGDLATTPHPEVFGDKLQNPYITTDFAESQVEVITPVSISIEETYNSTNILFDILSLEAKDELMWPQSMPSVIRDEDIIVAQFNDKKEGRQAKEYREKLLEKYGGKKQLISGIHYNFSFSEKFTEKLYKNSDKKLSYKDFKDQIYLKITRNYLRYGWLIVYLLGATPILHKSYKSECKGSIDQVSQDIYGTEGAISFRNGSCGYKNKVELLPDYYSVKAYMDSINRFVESNLITDHKELYNSIRLKPKNKKNFEESLLKDGIDYLEYRNIDINPFEKGGISLGDLHFLQIFNLFLLTEPENDYDKWQEEALENQNNIAEFGQKEITLKKNGKLISKTEWALEILDTVLNINKELDLDKEEILHSMIGKIKNPSITYSYRVLKMIKEEGFINGHLNLAKDYKKQAYENRFKLEGFEDLELSTQILMKEAIKRGIRVRILDRSENFLSLDKNNKVEYIKQATRTSLDNYISVLIMENKSVTKKVLHSQNIAVPKGLEVRSLSEVQKNIGDLVNMPIVIKPKSTNFGIGINIFKEGAAQEDIIKSWQIAHKYDNTVLIEEFIKGKEYRFLVIGDKVCGVLHRVPANVIGNGKDTIRGLVEIKNQDPLRGYHYVTPLEKINLDENAEIFLKQQNKDFDFIPKKGEVIYLRENSNISTGGDSIDYTDDIPERFKQIAIESTKAVNAKICGVDMMIEDYQNEDSNYAIIELNFNPAIHIHSYPYQGKERNIAVEMLKVLGYV